MAVMMTTTPRTLALVLLLSAATAGAEDAPPVSVEQAEGGIDLHYTVETGVATTYVFRGVPQYLEKTDPSSMTTLGLTLDKLGPGALSFGVWSAIAVTDRGAQPGTKSEIDLTLTYGLPLGDRLTAAAGYILYLYPEAPDGAKVDGAHELWASLSLAGLPVTPTLAVYAEIVRLKGVYAQASLARSFDLGGGFALSPWAGVALVKYDGVDGGLNDVTVSVPLRWTHGSGFYASLSGNYAYNGLLDEGSFSDASTLYALLAAGFSR
jgi:uncharacterized protein (TIGR02001 family)